MRPGDGVSLGVVISVRFPQMMGGDIHVASELGNGRGSR
jgi:hypothetical protein